MELRTLRYFLAVAEEGNVSKAARRLHLTQPTLSRQIQDLEERLGKPLFTRAYHRLDLTPEGLLLKARAAEIAALVERAASEIADSGDQIAGDVVLGCAETDMMRGVVRVVKGILDAHPRVRFHFRSETVGPLCDGLDLGTRDFGLVIGDVDAVKYERLALPWRVRWGLCMRKDHPLAVRKGIRSADLRGLPLICSRQFEKNASERSRFPGWFGEDFERMRVVVRNDLSFNGALLVEAGVGLLVGIEGLFSDAVRKTAGLHFVPFQPGIASSLHLVWKKDRVFNPACRLFLERMRSAADGAARKGARN